MKRRILSFILIFLIIFTCTFARYEEAKAVGFFEGVIGAVAGSTLGTGVAVGLAVCGLAYTGYTIYSHKDELAQAGEVIADAYVQYVEKKVTGVMEDVALAQIFVENLGEGVLEVGGKAWDMWKDFCYDLATNNLDISDFDGTIFQGQLTDFPIDVTAKQNISRPSSNQTFREHIAFGDYTVGLYSKTNIDLSNLRLATIDFTDIAIPVAIYGNSTNGTYIGYGTVGTSPLVPYSYVKAGNYNFCSINNIDYIGYVGLEKIVEDPHNVFGGSEYVFRIDDTYENFKAMFTNGTNAIYQQSILQGLIPKVFDIDNWDSGFQQVTDSPIDDYPVDIQGLTGKGADLEGVPDNIVDAVDGGYAWDVVPKSNIDNWAETGNKPSEISINDDVSSLALPGVNSLADAISYALEHGMSLSDVLAAAGIGVGDVARDIDYAATIDATLTDEAVSDESIPADKQTVIPIVPSFDVADAEFTLNGLDELFPFCVPFDIMRIIQFFNAKPKAPKFKWNVPTVKNGSVKKNEVEIDLSAYDGVAEVFRTLELLAFIFGFVLIVRNLIRG